MGFVKMLEILQEKNNRKIVLINTGAFYIAKGRDAILLHEILGLRVNCMRKEICKVGFPIGSLAKYCNTFNIGMDKIFSRYLKIEGNKNIEYFLSGFEKLSEKDKATIENLITYFNKVKN